MPPKALYRRLLPLLNPYSSVFKQALRQKGISGGLVGWSKWHTRKTPLRDCQLLRSSGYSNDLFRGCDPVKKAGDVPLQLLPFMLQIPREYRQ